MPRLSVLAIVITLATGPDSFALCQAWCAGATPAQECHEAVASTMVAADCCDDPATTLTAVLSGGSRQEAVPPHQEAAVAQQHVAAVPAALSLLRRLHQPLAPHPDCRTTVLRI
jgi:hypothetical protein